MSKKQDALKYHAFSRGIIIFLLIATLLLVLLDFPLFQRNNPPAVSGTINLENRYFNAQGITTLSGDWTVYPGEHLDVTSFTKGGVRYAPIAEITGISEKATYRLVVEKRAENEHLGLRIPAAYGDVKLFVNGAEIDTYSYGSASYAFFESGEERRMDILLHMTGSGHWFGGLSEAPEIGLATQMESRMIRNTFSDVLLLVTLLLSGILAFALFFMDEESKIYRYLALALLFAFLGVSGLREGLLFRYTDFLPLLFTRKLADVSAPLSMLFLCQFFFSWYPPKSDKGNNLKRVTFAVNLIGSVVVLVLPFFYITSAISLVMSRLILIFASIVCFLTALLAMGEHVPFSSSYTVGTLLLLIANITDTVFTVLGNRFSFSWYMFALLGLVPFMAFLKEFRDIRSDFGFTHFSLKQQINAAQLELEETRSLYEHQGMTDQMTGVYSRSFGEHTLLRKTQENFGDVHPFTAILIDVDDFRRINHQYGFSEANKVLINTAVALQDIIGENDILFRWGSDEFLILLPDCDAHQVQGRLKSIKLQLDRKNLSDREWISFCWAAATYGDRDNLLTFMKRLSDHMKEAKGEGRNSSSVDDFSPAFQIDLFTPSEEE